MRMYPVDGNCVCAQDSLSPMNEAEAEKVRLFGKDAAPHILLPCCHDLVVFSSRQRIEISWCSDMVDCGPQFVLILSCLSLANGKVADVVASIMDPQTQQQLQTAITTADFGVMTPFRKQVDKIRKVLRKRGYGNVRVGTIDDYQGQEVLPMRRVWC